MSCWKDQDQPAPKKRKCRGGELIVQIDTAVVLHSIHLDIVYIFSCSSCEHFVTQNHATFPQGCFSPSSIYTYTFFIFYLFFFAFDRKFPLLLYTSRGQSSLSLQVEEKNRPLTHTEFVSVVIFLLLLILSALLCVSSNFRFPFAFSSECCALRNVEYIRRE